MSDEMKRSMNNKPCDLIGKTDAVLSRLLFRPIEIYVDFTLAHRLRLEGEADNISNIIVMEKPLIEHPASARIHKDNRNPRGRTTEHPLHVRLYFFLLKPIPSVCVENRHGAS